MKKYLIGLALLMAPFPALSYPNGTPHYVTDVAPFCAACHSAVQRETMRDMAGMAEGELAVYKHLLPIKDRSEAYQKMSAEDAKALLAYIQAIDAAAKVSLEAPATAGKDGTIEVTAKFTGGTGPVVGLMLLDNNLRWESRSPSADGWVIVEAPAITGPDGHPQTKFLDHRGKGLKKNLSYVMVDGVEADVAAKRFAAGKVTWKLKAPRDAGNYTLAVAFLYGTEKGSPVGRGSVMPGVGQLPRGGFEGHSGRILFSDLKKIEVK